MFRKRANPSQEFIKNPEKSDDECLELVVRRIVIKNNLKCSFPDTEIQLIIFLTTMVTAKDLFQN